MSRRGEVWLGAAAVVENSKGELLVVEKSYGGLNGRWSFPAGFVDRGETLDEAAVREVQEETGISIEIVGCIGVRSGVLSNDVSDNMVLFVGRPLNERQTIQVANGEINRAYWLSKEHLLQDERSSEMIIQFCHAFSKGYFHKVENFNPGNQFGYKSYNLFL